MKNTFIHISDIHIRNQSRKDEYITVFDRLIDATKKENPRFVFFTGDLMHMKTNMSPTSIELATYLLRGLSDICDVFLTMGNHDTLIGNPIAGDAISPIIELLSNGVIVPKETKELTKEANSGNKIFFLKESGFYNFQEIVFSNYSCWDQEILHLTKKEVGKIHIATFHGAIKGAKLDNGYENKSEDSIKTSIFDNHNLSILGDFHTMQIVQELNSEKNKPVIAYAGSLLQQHYGEEVYPKGYILWNLDDFSYQFKHIPNDYGFAKLTIAKGENFAERIEHIQFSANKKKTKVYIIWEDYEENFSQEKENQIIKLVKDKHNCETVRVVFEAILKDVIVTEGDETALKQSEEYLKEFIETNVSDYTDEELHELLNFHSETNEKLEIVEGEDVSSEWKLEKVEISNIFSFPVSPTVIDWTDMSGITGIFGENGNGKSNVIKAMVWGLYKEILGGGDPRYIINIYTDSNKGYVKFWIDIDGQKYYIERSVKTTTKKDGSTTNSYGILYKKLEFEYDIEGSLDSEVWKNEESDERAAEKNEVGKLIENAIGTFDDFTKTSLQTQGGKDDYLSMSQQPKNNLVSKFLGLESYKLRYEFRKEFFNEIKKKQKELGDKIEIEGKIKQVEDEKDIKAKEYIVATDEKKLANDNKDKADSDILILTQKIEKLESVIINDEVKISSLITQYDLEKFNLDKEIITLESWLSVNFKKELLTHKLEKLDPVEISDATHVESLMLKNDSEVIELNKKTTEIELWLSTNFKKELPFDGSITVEQLNLNLVSEKGLLTKSNEEFLILEEWLKNNHLKKEINIDNLDKEIDDLKINISQLSGLLGTFKGKKCPTCSHVHQNADPIKEEECLEDIKVKSELLLYKQNKIIENSDIKNHNIKHERNNSKKDVLAQSISNNNEKIESINKKIELINQSKDIIEHNSLVEFNSINFTQNKNKIEAIGNHNQRLKDNLVKINNNKEKEKNNATLQVTINESTAHNSLIESNSTNLSKNKNRVEFIIKDVENLNVNLVKINSNKEKEKNNTTTQLRINDLTDLSKAYKLSVYNLDKQCANLFGDIRVYENDILNLSKKIVDIREYEQLFRKYSMYLQAMHKDGIPALIIRKKLPLINHRINTILQQAINFKVCLDVLANGDIVETFYFSETKTDTLPTTFASGAQKFVMSIAIKDALHYISSLTKPSLCIIDEGFGTLDDKNTFEIINILNYLKNKHKNVIIITHRNEIKDSADNIIEVLKVKKGLKQEVIDVNPEAGVTKLIFN